MKHVITRFAPSPTGYLHLGGLRTALFSYLWAKKNRGSFRLRIEDTDRERYVEGADTHLINLLRKLDIAPDGEIVYQSERTREGVYQRVAEGLIAQGHAYYCFCTPERLAELRKKQAARKEPPGYDGACRSIAPQEARRRRDSGEKAAVRLKWPSDAKERIVFRDELHGDVAFSPSSLEDAILLKSDGFPTYHLANVVDDHEMNITHVVRGEEWLPSAPLHGLLYDFLKYHRPLFYHIPLILNPDRSKLSKRQGHVSVDWYLSNGYLKEALINYVAFLGWNPGDEREIFSLPQLIKEFDLKKIHHAGAVFNIEKLQWYNSWYIKNILATKEPQSIAAELEPFLPDRAANDRTAIFTLFYERISTLAELPLIARFLWQPGDYPATLLVFKKSTREKTEQGLALARTILQQMSGEWTAVSIDVRLKRAAEEKGLAFGDIMWPVRAALSGLAASPPPADLAAYLGQKETLVRLDKAIQKIASYSQ